MNRKATLKFNRKVRYSDLIRKEIERGTDIETLMGSIDILLLKFENGEPAPATMPEVRALNRHKRR